MGQGSLFDRMLTGQDHADGMGLVGPIDPDLSSFGRKWFTRSFDEAGTHALT
jgi:hypothetical protein